jgi:drug/metabolite transporter (DMT)-like permease
MRDSVEHGASGGGQTAGRRRALIAPAQRRLGILLTALGAVLWSSAGLFSRAITADIWTVQFGRAVFGGLFMLAYCVYEHGVRTPQAFRRVGRIGIVVSFMSAGGIFSYVMALHLAPVANVMVVMATTPFVCALVAFLWLGEKVGPRTIAASALALIGVITMVASGTEAGHLWGGLFCFIMVVFFAFMVVMARRDPTLSMTPVNTLGALICAALVFPLAQPAALSMTDLVLLVGFGFVTLFFALLLFMIGARYIPSAEAGLIGLLDVVLGPIWVWWVFSEEPSRAALIGGGIVLAAVLWHMTGELKRERAAP